MRMAIGVARMLLTITVPIILAVVSYFGVSLASLAGRVDALSSTSAAQQQATKDIDTRLTRIENKLDNALARGVIH